MFLTSSSLSWILKLEQWGTCELWSMSSMLGLPSFSFWWGSSSLLWISSTTLARLRMQYMTVTMTPTKMMMPAMETPTIRPMLSFSSSVRVVVVVRGWQTEVAPMTGPTLAPNAELKVPEAMLEPRAAATAVCEESVEGVVGVVVVVVEAGGVVAGSITAVMVVEPDLTPTILTREVSWMLRRAQRLLMKLVCLELSEKKSLMSIAKCVVSWIDSVTLTRTTQSASSVTTKCTVQLSKKQALSPHTVLFNCLCRPIVVALTSVSSTGFMVLPLTWTRMELGMGQWSLTSTQLRLLPWVVLFWICSCMSVGGMAAKVMLQTWFSLTIDMNLPKRLFWGSLPIHSQSLQPLVLVVQGEPSQVRLTGHMMRVLKSAAMFSYSSVAKSSRWQTKLFMLGLQTQPASFSPMAELLGMTTPLKPRKVPVWSWMRQLRKPVQTMSPQPPNHPRWLSSGRLASKQLLVSQLRQGELKRLWPLTESPAKEWGLKAKLRAQMPDMLVPLQTCLKLSKVTLQMKTLLSQTGCLQMTSKPPPYFLGMTSPLAETVNMRMPWVSEQTVAEGPQHSRQLGRETAVTQELQRKPEWLVLPSLAPSFRVMERLLSAITKLLNMRSVEEGAPQMLPIEQAQALAQEKAWHCWEMVLKMKPMKAEPTVLLAKGLVSNSLHLMWGKANPWPSEPWQKLFLTLTWLVAGSTYSRMETQAMSSPPTGTEGRGLTPMMRLLVKVNLVILAAWSPKTKGMQKTLLLMLMSSEESTLMQKALQFRKEEALTLELSFPFCTFLKTKAEFKVSYCPPLLNCTPLSWALPTLRMAPSRKPNTITVQPHPRSGPDSNLMLRLTWPTLVLASRDPTVLVGEVMVRELEPQWPYCRAGLISMEPSELMALMVTFSYSVALEQEGEITRVSPTAQSELAPTFRVVVPAAALWERKVETVPGAVPKRLREPVTTRNLLAERTGSMGCPTSVLSPLTWMVNLWMKGLEALPAVTLPARMWMDLAVMFTSRVSSAKTVPSMTMKPAGKGSTSSRTVQLPLTQTSLPGAGTVLLGHWEALLQTLTKGSLMKVPAGAGQRNSQMMPLTSVYSRKVLPLPLWQTVNMRREELSLLWQWSPLLQLSGFRQSLVSGMQLSLVSSLPPRIGPTLQNSLFSLQLNLKMMPLSEGVKVLLEVMARWLKSMPEPHQMLQMRPVMKGSAQVVGFSFLASMPPTIQPIQEQRAGSVLGSTSSSMVEISAAFRCWCMNSCLLSRLVKATLRMVMVWSHMTAQSHLAAEAAWGQVFWLEVEMWLQLLTMVAEVRAAPVEASPPKAELKEASRSQITSRLSPIMNRQLPLMPKNFSFSTMTSVPVLVNLRGSSHSLQVCSRMLPAGKLQKRMSVNLVVPERGVISADMPRVQLVGSAATLVCDLPMMALFCTVGGSFVKFATKKSNPLWQFSATVKFLKMTLPVCSASTPDSKFLQSVKLEKIEGEEGLEYQGSVALVSSRTSWQGYFREYRWKRRRPNRRLEWATLFATLPSGLPIGQTSFVAEGPSGLGLISYQMPQKSLPAAWLPQKSLVGLVIQKDATEVSVCNMLVTCRELTAKLLRMMFLVSMPSSTKKLWPRTLWPTLSSTVRKWTPWRVTTLAKESWTALPRTQEVGTSPFMWKWMQQRPRIWGCPQLVNSVQAMCPSAPLTALPEIMRWEPYFLAIELSSPIILMFLVSRPTSALICRLSVTPPTVWVSLTETCLQTQALSTVMVLPETERMVLRSASSWKKLVEASTISSPAFQSMSSPTVRVVSPGRTVAEMEVQVGVRGAPYMENLHSMQPMPLLPCMGSCLPQYPPYMMNVSLRVKGLRSVPAMNRPPTRVMNPARTVTSVSLEKRRVPFSTAMPSSWGVSWSTRRVMPWGTKTRSPAMGG